MPGRNNYTREELEHASNALDEQLVAIEVAPLSDWPMNNGGEQRGDDVIEYTPAGSVLKLEIGEAECVQSELVQ